MADKPPPFTKADAQWLAHRYDRPNDAVQFRFTPRTAHRDAAFLTDEYLGEPTLPMVSRLRSTVVNDAPQTALHFLFHSAFCNSTLLCRALDVPSVAMGLSEPVILNDLVGIRRRREVEPRQLGELTDHALRLLARPWGPNEAVVVKPSNILNPLGAGFLSLRPESRALLLHAPLDLFLNSVARKGLWCRLWVRELLEGFLADGFVDLGFTQRDYFRQGDLQVAAVGWLAQHAQFHRLAAQFGRERVRSLNSERISEQPAKVLSALGRHFNLSIDGVAIAAGPAFTRHSKSGDAFSMDARRAEQAATAAAHGDEIEKVTGWALAVAEQNGIALDLPHPL